MTSKLVNTRMMAVLAIAVAAFALFGLTQVSSASTPAATTKPTLVAVAIGQLDESGGSYATVDLHAAVRGDATRGALRFFAEDQGYYNGAVKSLTCQDGVITVKGGGGFFTPDGKRHQVVFEATFNKDTGATTITVKGRNGFQYALTGTLDGVIRCGDPAKAPTTA